MSIRAGARFAFVTFTDAAATSHICKLIHETPRDLMMMMMLLLLLLLLLMLTMAFAPMSVFVLPVSK